MDFWRQPLFFFFSRLPVRFNISMPASLYAPTFLSSSFPFLSLLLLFPLRLFHSTFLPFPLFSLSFFLSFSISALISFFTFLSSSLCPSSLPVPSFLSLFLASPVPCFLPFVPSSVFSSLCPTTFSEAASGNLNVEFTACEFYARLILDVTPPHCNSEV